MQRTRSGVLHFSADNLSAEDRGFVLARAVRRQMIGLDIEPLRDAEFFGDLTLHALPGLKICRGITGGGRTRRTPELISDGNDDVSLWVNLEGPVAVSRRGEEIVLGEQEAVLGTLGDVGGFTRRTSGRHLCLQIPRAAIAPLVPAVDDAVARRIPRDSTALRLLANYAGTLHEHEMPADPRLDRQIVNHIYDLTAVVIGATRDAMEVACGRGVRAARLRAIKTDIAANLGHGDLSADALAARHGITPRYLRMLFESEGTSFSQFVLGQRLLRAHRMLCSSLHLHLDRAIGSIAFECGFGDISYFYRAFRRRYGDTPSDVREAARREQE
jgi:AraC-like DNA-binding protein